MNWQSTLSFNENIKMTINWYRAYYTNKDPRKIEIILKESKNVNVDQDF